MACFVLAVNASAQSNFQNIRGSRPAALEKLKPLSRYSPTNRLNLVLGLPLRNEAALASLLRDLYDPASSGYHKYLTASEFAERFAPSVRDYEATAQFATSHGLKIAATHANRTLLDVNGTVADIEKAFRLRMWLYQHPAEARTCYAPDADPSVDLPVPLLGIQGLDNFDLPRPMDLKSAFDSTNAPKYAAGSGPAGYYIGNDFRAAYMPGVTLTGKGQLVGLFELDGYFGEDIAEYESLAKLPSVTLSNILLDGFSGTPGVNQVEVTLDIDMALSMAPGLAAVLVYEGTSPNDVLNRMALDNSAKQLSCSWGFPPAIDPVREQIYEQFAAQGQTMFQASGNSGAFVGAPQAPSDDPNLTVVGGTQLTTSGPGGPWSAETAWPGSGGGSSTNFPIPTWQQGLRTPGNQASSAFRSIPDVAAVAGVSIWLIAAGGQQGPIGGTSAAAPMWAGIAALANQRAAAQGIPPIGFINPTLYAIGRSANYASAFHDITAGNNTNAVSPTNYFAAPGYDLSTGWGAPAGNSLIQALLRPPDALQVFPATNLMAGGAMGGPFSPPSVNVVLTNIGATTINWAASSTAQWLNVAPNAGTVSPGGAASLVVLTLNSAAVDLSAGSYSGTVWFTNQSDGFVQSRQFILNVAITSAAPVIVRQPVSQTALPGGPAVFTVTAAGDAPLRYQWQENSNNLHDGENISGSTTPTLVISNVSTAAGTYAVIVSNALNSAVSAGAVLSVAPVAASGVTLSSVYAFTGTADGANPNGLMQHSNGNFYGTTQDGGADSAGTVFKMTPDGSVTTMYSFSNSGGGGFLPEAGLVQGADGYLYGTTEGDSSNGFGTIFKITTNGNLTTVLAFTGTNGAFPFQPMILGADGNFYGTTAGGGTGGAGEIFRLTANGALTLLAPFSYTNGSNPNKLLQGADGGLYGTTFAGGDFGDGVVFRATTNGTLTTLSSFAFFNGGYLPSAGLAQTPGSDFYGTTFEGGSFGFGAVFSMPASGEVTTRYSFSGGNDGGHPAADLIRGSDGNFYGTTVDGGLYGDGTVFRWSPDGDLTTLVSFDGYDGANPEAPLVEGSDGNLYGTTQNGGASGNGVIFRVNITSPGLQIAGEPAGQSVFLGASAVFSVAVIGNPPLSFQWMKGGTNLIDGADISGARSLNLTISDVTVADTGIYSLAISNTAGAAAASDGAFLAVLVSPPQFVLPMANQIGAVGGSVTFAPDVVGNLPLYYQWQSNHVNLTDGANVSGATTGSLTLSALTQLSDATYTVIVSNSAGVTTTEAVLAVFPVSVPGTVVSSLHWFTGGADGGVPNGLTLGSNGVLYGTTQTGGANNLGTVFSVTTNGTFQTLVSFNGTNGSNPQAALLQGTNGNFYGTTQDGGTSAAGTAFEMTPDGTLTTLAAFDNGFGPFPYTALVQGTNGNFYGSTQNASKQGDGNIFELTPSGALSDVYSFTGGQDGNEPVGALTQGTDGDFYGLTTAGGAHSYGGVFKMTPAGELTNLYSFTGGTDGYNPYGALVQGDDGDFYGVTRRNVVQNVQFDGTIFKVFANGAFTTLYTLNPLYNGDGEYPFAGLIEGADGNFYGTTLYSDSTVNGTIFRITATGVYTTLSSFNGTDDGTQPKSAMVQDVEGNLYGTTTAGGPFGHGSIFRLSFTSAPQITLQPASQTAIDGGKTQFTVSVFGASPLNYQWQRNGANLTDDLRVTGSLSRVLSVNNINTNDAGTYSVVVSNTLGSVTSSNALLTVTASAPVFQSVAQQSGMLTFTWSAAPGLTYQVQSTPDLALEGWTNVGGVIVATNTTVNGSYVIDSALQQFYRVLLLP